MLTDHVHPQCACKWTNMVYHIHSNSSLCSNSRSPSPLLGSWLTIMGDNIWNWQSMNQLCREPTSYCCQITVLYNISHFCEELFLYPHLFGSPSICNGYCLWVQLESWLPVWSPFVMSWNLSAQNPDMVYHQWLVQFHLGCCQCCRGCFHGWWAYIVFLIWMIRWSL